MKFYLKKISIYFLIINFFTIFELKSKNAPESFADLAEKLMPSVVNISTTQTIKTQASAKSSTNRNSLLGFPVPQQYISSSLFFFAL